MPPSSFDDQPAIGQATAALPGPPPLPRRRLGWLGHLLILTAWILVAVAGAFSRSASARAHVPLGDASTLLRRVAVNTLLFAIVCAAAWLCSRAPAAERRLRWSGAPPPTWGGVLSSVGMRVALFVVAVVVVVAVQAVHPVDPRTLQALRPHVEAAVSPQALAKNRAFYWLVVTLLSSMAGLLEEVWRGGMFAGLAGVFPAVFGGRSGPWAAILPSALLFGLGHLYMGWLAVTAATLLGLMLGAIMVWHRTIWPAVITHACFDAASFAWVAWIAQHHPQVLGS